MARTSWRAVAGAGTSSSRRSSPPPAALFRPRRTSPQAQARSSAPGGGLDAFPWLDRSLYTAKGGVRTTNVIRVYFASTFADFQDEFKALHETTFPKLEALCQAHGYNFVPVVMRFGLDERLDLMYMNDTRICPIVFREIAECRRSLERG